MLIKFGSIVVDGRGKLGGQVYSKNKSGNYVRNNAIPTNPRTTHQMASRALLSEVSRDWSALTEEQRNAWDSATEEFKRTNAFGDRTKLSGKNLYSSINKNLLQVGANKVQLPPDKVDVGQAIGGALEFNMDEETLQIDLEMDGTADYLVIRATPPVSPGTKFVKNKLRIVRIVEDATPEEAYANIWDDYVDRFGLPSEGKSIYAGIYSVGTDGVRTSELIIRAVETEND